MYKLSKLKNGITLITAPVKGTMATTVLCLFPVGSRYEGKKINGVSHFVEHMMFKGTLKRPSAQDISRVLEAAGADYNAFTNKDYTGYYVKIDASRQELAYNLLSDMIYNSKMDEAEMTKEKGAIVEELRMYKDNPTMAIDMLFDNLVFGDHPLGWDIGGSADTVRGLTRQELFNYYQNHYSPKNMVLVVAGKIDNKLKKYLQYFVTQKAPAKAEGPAYYKNHFVKFNWTTAPVPLANRVAVEQRKLDQAHLILGFCGLPNNHPGRYAATILFNILGAGMSSRLFVEVREKRGLAYMVRAGATSYRDTGVCYVQAGLDPARLGEAIKVIKGELARIADEPVTAAELNDAKSSIAGRLALSMEDSSGQAEWFARQFLFATKMETPEGLIKKLNKVTIAEVQKMAKQFFSWNNVRVAVIGPLEKDKVVKMVE